MKKQIFATLAAVLSICAAHAQLVMVTEAKFHVGDNPAWSAPAFDDGSWQTLSLVADWDRQGISNTNGFGWYRIHAVIPSSLKESVTGQVLLDLGPIDDSDETWLNGHLVGKTGTTPHDAGGYEGFWTKPRRYVVDPELIRWDEENVIAVQVYNGGDPGGFYQRPAFISFPELKDYVTLSLTGKDGKGTAVLKSAVKTAGTLTVVVKDEVTGEVVREETAGVELSPEKEVVRTIPYAEQQQVSLTYRDHRFDDVAMATLSTPYILTPPAPLSPRYNGPLVFGVTPGAPLIFRMPFSGERPMRFEVEGLPEGVTLDAEHGVLGGSVDKRGNYPLVFRATNAKGTATAAFTLKVGDTIGLTPPMGWNSWNCWGLSVSQEKVMASAQALIDKGLADYGYAYMNIDDAWQADSRDADGTLQPNSKFPDVKGLADWLHSRGLRLGIYSSPGDRTCGNYLGSLGHEQKDAETWNSWGVDYLKYDWCGYAKVFEAQDDRSTASYVRPYLKMEEYLRQQPRDIFYSLCQYGMADVWTWGHAVDANSWRTTGDITDTWESLCDIGFGQQPELYPYAGPGHWNDPDMLVVGKVGWGETLHDSRLTADEQYTHITLWALLAANMLIGCDLSQIDDFTLNLLCNNEVNAVNQDPLGKQATCDVAEDDMQQWSRPLADGSKAVGIFNLGDGTVPMDLAGSLDKMGITGYKTVRDLWRQKDLTMGTYEVPSHGVMFLKVSF